MPILLACLFGESIITITWLGFYEEIYEQLKNMTAGLLLFKNFCRAIVKKRSSLLADGEGDSCGLHFWIPATDDCHWNNAVIHNLVCVVYSVPRISLDRCRLLFAVVEIMQETMYHILNSIQAYILCLLEIYFGPGTGLLLSRKCSCHDKTYFRMSARTFESMLWRLLRGAVQSGGNLKRKLLIDYSTHWPIIQFNLIHAYVSDHQTNILFLTLLITTYWVWDFYLKITK